MPRFAANIDLLFTELPPGSRPRAAREAGFAAVDFQFPYAHDLDRLAAAVQDAGVQVGLFNLPAGDFAAGERGIAALPGREREFRAGLDVARRYARRLGCRRLNALAGIPRPGQARAECLAVLTANLAHAARTLADDGIMVVTEPLNSRDVPGFLITRPVEALAVIEAAGVSNLKLQYDIYHAQVMEGDLIASITRLAPRIGHIQFADNPGRHEPGTGEINFPNVFAAIDRSGYAGWVAAEYRPQTTTADSLGWLRAAAAA
ncbi:MAG: hydroxypyruvate isomerase family protein [Alphaproteobacteria bacterium]|nr:hydroxypyruvate isomerase family protein [Alphaproteobacteria bacterium]